MMPLGHIISALGTVQLGRRIFPNLNSVDWRVVALAPLVPDMIDKPLAIFISSMAFSPVDSRLVAHTFLPSILLLAIGFFFRRDWLPYSLAFNTHLITDRMWENPSTLFWPIYGWTTFFNHRFFQARENVGYGHMIEHLLILLVELGALAALTWLVQRNQLWRWRNLKHFFGTGHLKPVRQISSL